MAKGGGLGMGRARVSWKRGCCGDLKVVLVFWIFSFILVNFVCCYRF